MSEDNIHPPFLGHPTGITFDIVGIKCGDQGRSCDEHEDACNSVVLREDAVVRIRKVQICGQWKGRVCFGRIPDCCQVGFLHRHLLKRCNEYHGRIAQITNMCGDSESPTMERKNKQNWGCCEAVLIDSVMYKKPEVVGPLIAAGTATPQTNQEDPPRKKKRK
jgi:hypothetical protein